MTEQQILEAMHTQAAAQPWAVNVAALADDDEDYTWAGPSYPAVPALAADNARLHEQITQLHCDYSAQIATLELRVRELEAWIDAVPSGALIDYYYGSGALNYDAREARPVVGAWIRRLEDENAIALREARP